jgi:hypothetical protein
MDPGAAVFLSTLVQQAPVLLVYLAAIFLALMFWRRCPTPCALTLGAGVLLLVVSLGQSFLNLYIYSPRDGATLADRATLIAVVGLAGGILRALGYGLLLAAVFHGRSSPQEPSAE